MTLKTTIITTIVFLQTLGLCYSQNKYSTTKNIILQTERKIVDAVIKTDTVEVSSYLSTDYTYTLPNGKIISKNQYISDIANWWRPLTIDLTDQKVTIYQKTAIIIGKAKYRWKNKNGEVEEAVEQYTDTYIRLKDKWVRVCSHASCLSGRCI
jgi:hypothetical protein